MTTDRGKIAKAYAKDDLFFDLVSTLPTIAILLRKELDCYWFKFLRLKRIGTMKRYVKIFVDIFGKGINFTKSQINTAVYFSDFFLTLIFCMHFLACMWVWIGTTLDYSWIDYGNFR
jgi:hypothetical protein